MSILSRHLASVTRVLIVDDSQVFRRVARELLERRGYEIAGEANCASTAVNSVRHLEPDAVLLDLHLPDENGFALACRLTQSHPEVAVLLTSMDFDEQYFSLARRSGARGFLPKSLLARADLRRFWGTSKGRS